MRFPRPQVRPGPGRFQARCSGRSSIPSTSWTRSAYIYPDKVAVVDGERRYSYQDFAQHTWRLANGLGPGVACAKGDRVATLLFNSSAHAGGSLRRSRRWGILVASQLPALERRNRVHPPSTVGLDSFYSTWKRAAGDARRHLTGVTVIRSRGPAWSDR